MYFTRRDTAPGVQDVQPDCCDYIDHYLSWTMFIIISILTGGLAALFYSYENLDMRYLVARRLSDRATMRAIELQYGSVPPVNSRTAQSTYSSSDVWSDWSSSSDDD